MSKGKEPPRSLGPHGRRFVDRLRELKDRSGLSLAALANRTSYSKSSWERYLNGKSLPSAEAVRELAGLCGADANRLLALHSLAADDWDVQADARVPGDVSGAAAPGREPGPDVPGEHAARDVAGGSPAGEAPPADDGTGDGTTQPLSSDGQPNKKPLVPARVRLGSPALIGVVAVAALVVSGLLVYFAPRTEGASEDRRVASTKFVFTPGRTHGCDVHRDNGKLWAGHSDTNEAFLQQITTSWDVVEAQCLLEHRGYPVGAVDGAYGQATERAVKRLQENSGLVVDGIVGPHTWQALRQ
ncbi:peptidoglycan-binding protein [Streptomyces sp. PTY087I2]|uniref:peptidoglycan-binding protein n=1 Tax=Streptomyces sp. PTY087I2 TaxID=1819298 RepID=UPI000828BC7B|nr:peptidoglycan-binding protein [Streptomyces sp. PTY087I2]OCC10052.1 Spore cortex-lytic enzyme precursor [Streptomyces sp. PTY087I2]